MNKIEELTKAYQDAGAEWRAADREHTALRTGTYANTGEWTTKLHGRRPPEHVVTALELKREEARDREWTIARELRPLLVAAEVEAGDADAMAYNPAKLAQDMEALEAEAAHAREVLRTIEQRLAQAVRLADAARERLGARRLAAKLPQPVPIPVVPDPTDPLTAARLRAIGNGEPEAKSPFFHMVKAAQRSHIAALANAERRRLKEEEETQQQKRNLADREKRARADAAEKADRANADREAQRLVAEENERLAAAFAARMGESS